MNNTEFNELEKRLKRELLRRKAKTNLLGFTRYTFDGEYQVNWHHSLIADEIGQWLKSKEPYHLLLQVPPQHGKSELSSRMSPGYIFGKNPDTNFMLISYSSDWAESLSLDAQKIMLSKAYSEVFPNTQLATKGGKRDATSIRRADEFNIVGHRGKFRAAGILGGITGRPADIIVLDDPFKNREEAESEGRRKKVIAEYKASIRTRLGKGGRILMLLTRWHEEDLAGHVINQMQNDPDADIWKVVNLPAIYEKSEFSHPKDKRKEGEALWVGKYPLPALKKLRATLGSYDWNALFQQRPSPPGGSIIKREWFTHFIPKSPMGLRWVRYYDLAVGEKKQNDHTASIQMAIDADENVFIRGGFRGKWSWPKGKKILTQVALREKDIEIGVEDFGTQKGFVQDLQNEKALRSVSIRGCSQPADKLTRALPWIAKLEAGKFYIVGGGGWIDEFIDECVRFIGSASKEDDQVDAVSGAYYMLSSSGGGISSLGNVT